MQVNMYELAGIADANIRYVAILARHHDKWLLSRHKKRNTWEFAGGHREADESLDQTAARELYEETGAVVFSLYPVAIYSVRRDGQDESFGQLYYTEVSELAPLPDFEMSEIAEFEQIPENLTYPLIYPAMIERVAQFVQARPIR